MDVDEYPISGFPVEKEGRSATHQSGDTMEPSQGTPLIWASAEATGLTQASPHILEGFEPVETGRTALGPDDNRSPTNTGRSLAAPVSPQEREARVQKPPTHL